MVFGLFSRPNVHPAECVIKVDGEPITDLYRFVTEVTVNATRDQFAEGTISFYSPVDEADQWLVADDPRLATWSEVSIEADFQDATEEVLRGVILRIENSFPANAGEANVRVVCRDDSARLDRGLRSRRWGEEQARTTDVVILQTLAGEAGLTPHPESGPGMSNLLKTQNTSDIDFLKRRANANGYELLFRDGQIYFGPRRLSMASQPTIMVYAGQATNCRSFSPRNEGQRVRAVSYARRDANGDPGSPVTVEADLELMGTTPAKGAGNGLPEQVDFLGLATVPDDAESEAMARARANDGDMSVIAQGELDGSLYGHVLRVGEPVEVDGVGERYSGKYYVDSVTHRFDARGYDQSFSLSRNALGRAPGGPSLPGVPL
jgi:phage protein D